VRARQRKDRERHPRSRSFGLVPRRWRILALARGAPALTFRADAALPRVPDASELDAGPLGLPDGGRGY
jgi:hypothetical protein